MEDPEKIALAEAVLSGLLKWELLRIQDYEQFDGSTDAKDALRSERRLETMFLLRRSLHVGYYQIIARELRKDVRWDAQRADLLREGIQTLVSPTGTFEPRHHSKEPMTKSRRAISPRHHQKRYHEHFPEFFFEPGTPPARRGRDTRFKILSTVFSPLDVPGYFPARSPFFVLDPQRVATPRFIWTAQTVPGTSEFAEDLVSFRDLVHQTMRDIPAEGKVAEERKQLIQRWLTTYGTISVAFRAQIAAIASVQWFRRQDAERRRALIGIPCPRDDAAMDPQRVVTAYERLGLNPRSIDAIVATASEAAQDSDEWWRRMDEASATGLAQLRAASASGEHQGLP